MVYVETECIGYVLAAVDLRGILSDIGNNGVAVAKAAISALSAVVISSVGLSTVACWVRPAAST